MKLRRKLILKKQQEKTEDQYHNKKYRNRELRLEIEQENHPSEHNLMVKRSCKSIYQHDGNGDFEVSRSVMFL